MSRARWRSIVIGLGLLALFNAISQPVWAQAPGAPATAPAAPATPVPAPEPPTAPPALPASPALAPAPERDRNAPWLKSLYEQYFQGIEKLEPAIPRKELERVLEVLRKNQPRNTALRFRTQMLIAKYGTYVTYWQRIARQIEEGTYRRDVARAKQRRLRDAAPERDREAETPGAWELDVDVDEVEDLRSFSFDDSDVDQMAGESGRDLYFGDITGKDKDMISLQSTLDSLVVVD